MCTELRRPRGGFTLIEMLVVVAIIGILASILMPVFSAARAKARQASCISNQRQLAIAITMYATDHERYPNTDWLTAIELDRKILVCPDKSDAELGYGMNSYLHTTKPDLIQKTSEIIATCDASYSSTVSAEYGRHGKGAVFSRLDGSAVFARKPGEAGRFSCGKFPIEPIIVMDDFQSLEAPTTFVEYNNETAGDLDVEPTAQFAIIGPYGNGEGDGTTEMANLMNIDYIGEYEVMQRLADASPIPGEFAPKGSEIDDVIGADLPKTAGSPINQFKKWTIIPGVDSAKQAKMELANNYNCEFHNRTTYAAIYVFSKEAFSTQIGWHSDDGGKVWMNGFLLDTDTTEDSGGSPKDPPITTIIPRGISYILVRCTNSGAGGMKFKLVFKVPAGKSLSFSPTLE